MTAKYDDLFCARCHTNVPVVEALITDPPGRPRCPMCGDPLMSSAPLIGNPFPVALATTTAGALARLLISSGVLDLLKERANDSETKVDDVALCIAMAVIEQVAKL